MIIIIIITFGRHSIQCFIPEFFRLVFFSISTWDNIEKKGQEQAETGRKRGEEK